MIVLIMHICRLGYRAVMQSEQPFEICTHRYVFVCTYLVVQLKSYLGPGLLSYTFLLLRQSTESSGAITIARKRPQQQVAFSLQFFFFSRQRSACCGVP